MFGMAVAFHMLNALQMDIMYLLEVKFFPPCMRAKAFQISQTISRGVASLAPLIILYPSTLYLLSVSYFLMTLTTFIMHVEPFEEKELKLKEDLGD